MEKNNTIENIVKLAKEEAELLKYYGYRESRKEEQFNDILFYNRMKSIGYCKTETLLDRRCPRSFINSLSINDFDLISGPRNHTDSVYTPLEFVIYNKIDGYKELISEIKGY